MRSCYLLELKKYNPEKGMCQICPNIFCYRSLNSAGNNKASTGCFSFIERVNVIILLFNENPNHKISITKYNSSFAFS